MEYEYSITVTYDSAPTPTWSARYDNALDAVSEFNKFVDHGLASQFATINLSEPSGKMHTKIFYANGNVGGK